MSKTSAIYCLREVATGITKAITFRQPELSFWDDGEDGNSLFVWSEHNFSCDCNRELFFTDWECDGEQRCGEGRFLLRVTAADDGRILYDEWDVQPEETP